MITKSSLRLQARRREQGQWLGYVRTHCARSVSLLSVTASTTPGVSNPVSRTCPCERMGKASCRETCDLQDNTCKTTTPAQQRRTAVPAGKQHARHQQLAQCTRPTTTTLYVVVVLARHKSKTTTHRPHCWLADRHHSSQSP